MVSEDFEAESTDRKQLSAMLPVTPLRDPAACRSRWPLRRPPLRPPQPPSSASLTAPEWLYDSSTVKPSANQPQNTSTGAASLYEGLNRVRECLWVFPLGGSYWQLIPIRKQWIRMVADFFFWFLEKILLMFHFHRFGGNYSTLLLSLFIQYNILYYTIMSANMVQIIP